jgi:uncharacterized small protein (DUF1192 family)
LASQIALGRNQTQRVAALEAKIERIEGRLDERGDDHRD